MAKHFTFRVVCTFEMQHTFDESKVGGKQVDAADERMPTDAALGALRHAIELALAEHFAVSWLSIDREEVEILGVQDDRPESESQEN